MLEAVKQWAFTLVITAVVGGLANSFTISSESGGMKKYVKFACAAVALAVMIMPVRELFRELPGLPYFNANAHIAETGGHDNNEYIDRINSLAAAKTDELIKRRISDIVYEKTGIKPDDAHIYIGYIRQEDYSEIEIGKIEITVGRAGGGAPPVNSEEVRIYLERLFNCEVLIL